MRPFRKREANFSKGHVCLIQTNELSFFKSIVSITYEENSNLIYSLPVYLGTHLTSLGTPSMLKLFPSNSRHCSRRKSTSESAGHSHAWHDSYRTRGPTQKSPPPAGRGESQARSDRRIPPPQLRLHSDHAFHSPHAPSTGSWISFDFGTHLALMHHRPSPQLVPSAQGMCCVRQPLLSGASDSPSEEGVVHQSRVHGGYKVAQSRSVHWAYSSGLSYHVLTDFSAVTENELALFVRIKELAR